jgi:uncharacterized protein YkwD
VQRYAWYGPAPAQRYVDPVASEIVRLTNVQRQRYGLRPLVHSPRLEPAAASHAAAMAQRNQLSHSLPGSTLNGRLQRVGYRWSACAENIACGQSGAQDAVSCWMSSSGHRRNILSPSYTQIGVAVRRSSNGTPYYCQVFGSP